MSFFSVREVRLASGFLQVVKDRLGNLLYCVFQHVHSRVSGVTGREF